MELLNFIYRSNMDIRTAIDEKGLLWVSLADLCNVVGIKNTRNVYHKLDDDEKGVQIMDTPGGTQKMQMVNEFGVYHALLTSHKPEAKPFVRWITHEVIPSIRKNGKYEDTENKFEKTCPIPIRDIFKMNAGRYIKEHGGQPCAKYIWYTWYRDFEHEKGITFFDEAKAKGVRPIDWLKVKDMADDFYRFTNQKIAK